MKTTKRFLSIVLMLAMLVSMFTVMAFADDSYHLVTVDLKVENAGNGNKGKVIYTGSTGQNLGEYTSDWTIGAFSDYGFVAQPADGYTAKWETTDNGVTINGNNVALTNANSAVTLKVTFVKASEEPAKKYKVEVTINGTEYGKVTDSNNRVIRDGSTITVTDQTVTLTATANEGKVIDVIWNLNNSKSGYDKTFSFDASNLDKDAKNTLTITLVELKPIPDPDDDEDYKLTVNAGDHGSIRLKDGSLRDSDWTYLAVEDSFKVEAVADDGYHFVKWEASGISLSRDQAKTAELTGLEMPAKNVTLTAKFERDDYYGSDRLYIDITGAKHGTVQFLNDDDVDDNEYFWLRDGETYTIYATADRGYTAYWSYDGDWHYGGSFTFKMNKDENTLRVEFVKDGCRPDYDDDSHTLTIDITGEKHGTVKRGTTKIYDGYTMSLDKNDTRTFKATPDKGYVAVWTFRGESYVGNEFTVKMGSKNATLYIEFMDEDDYRLWNLPFRDVSERDWFYSDVAYVYANGYMEGISSTKFAPNQNTTRAQIVTILWRLTGEPRAMRSNKFNDVSSSAYYDQAVSWAVEAGVVNGFDAKTFKPNDYVTREQLAAILYRYAEYMNLSTRGASNLSNYNDYYQIGSWARDAMAWANYHGLINGVSYSRIDPKGYATRAQIAAILHRFAVEFGNY